MDKKVIELIFVGLANNTVSITPSATYRFTNGAAYYAAAAAALFASPIGLVTRIGNDFDLSNISKNISRDGISVSTKQKSACLTVSFAKEDMSGQPHVRLDLNAASVFSPDNFPKAWFAHAKIIHIATMAPGKQHEFISFFKQHVPHTILTADTGYSFLQTPENRKLVVQNFQQCDLVFINRAEYGMLARNIQKFPAVIYKKDKDGAEYLKNGETVFSCPAPEVKVKDVMGAGDILAGAYLAQMLKKKDKERSLQKAVSLASRSITAVGLSDLINS